MTTKNNFKLSKKIIATIFVSLVIFCLFILILEIVLRTTHLFGARVSWSKPDPILGWRYIPNSTYWCCKENDHPITGKINSYGWRDKEWVLKKSPNTYRIAIIGDSFVEAFQVESERTFLALTESELNKNFVQKVEIMNFGRAGFTQTEELLVLKNHVEQFSPDMVIVFFLPGNDIRDVNGETAHNFLHPFYHISENGELKLDTSSIEMSTMVKSKIKRLAYRLDRYSALISLIYQRYDLYRQPKAEERAKTADGNKLGGYLSLCTANPDSTYLKNYQLNKALIKAMAEYCKGKGIKFMLVTIDNGVYHPEEEKRYKFIDPTFDANYFEDDLGNYAVSLNIEYLGLQRTFRKAYENTGISLHWGHWNYQGHEVVADALVDKLKSGIVPSTEW